jgi:hypothetical protein
MKIAAWNIERPIKTSKRIPVIIACLKEIDPDILILTETNECIDLGDEYNVFHTGKPSEDFYKEGERRTSIYSKYQSIGQIKTFRDNTSICMNLQTPFGTLAVYGTIIGNNGNRRKDFIQDLDQQLLDYDSIAVNGNLCIAGDLNMSFADNYYFTEEGRNKLNVSFKKNNLINLTGEIENNIDHIILSKNFIGERKSSLQKWNYPVDKKLSDHIGICVIIE